MTGRRWKWLLSIVCIGPLLIWGYDRALMMHWVGSTDLDVEFAVTDTDSGVPIPGARVEVQSEGGFYEEGHKQDFVLVADTSGSAHKECRNSMCFGTCSGLGFTNAYAVHLPFWRFRAVALGYEPGEWVELDVPEYVRQVKRSGSRQATLVVPISLHKSRS